MTNEQEKACEALRIKWATEVYERDMEPSKELEAQIPVLGRVPWDTAYEVAQSPDQLLLNPLVKGLVEALMEAEVLREDDTFMIEKALQPFGKDQSHEQE